MRWLITGGIPWLEAVARWGIEDGGVDEGFFGVDRGSKGRGFRSLADEPLGDLAIGI